MFDIDTKQRPTKSESLDWIYEVQMEMVKELRDIAQHSIDECEPLITAITALQIASQILNSITAMIGTTDV